MAAGIDHRKTYLRIWMALLVLTVITVGAAYIEFGGNWNIVIAMFIATVKATLVGLYFMHLKYDNLVNQVVFASSFVFLSIFIIFTICDIMARLPI